MSPDFLFDKLAVLVELIEVISQDVPQVVQQLPFLFVFFQLFTYSVEVYVLDYLPISVFFKLFTYTVQVGTLDYFPI